MRSAGTSYRVGDVDLLFRHPGVIEVRGVLLTFLYHYVVVSERPRRCMFFETIFKFSHHSFRASDAAHIPIYQVYFLFISYISLIFICLVVEEVQLYIAGVLFQRYRGCSTCISRVVITLMTTRRQQSRRFSRPVDIRYIFFVGRHDAHLLNLRVFRVLLRKQLTPEGENYSRESEPNQNRELKDSQMSHVFCAINILVIII